MQILPRNYLARTIRRVFLLARIMPLPLAPWPNPLFSSSSFSFPFFFFFSFFGFWTRHRTKSEHLFSKKHAMYIYSVEILITLEFHVTLPGKRFNEQVPEPSTLQHACVLYRLQIKPFQRLIFVPGCKYS